MLFFMLPAIIFGNVERAAGDAGRLPAQRLTDRTDERH